jgi:hypothetical protein
MSTRYTSSKAPGMAVTVARDGLYIEMEGDMIKASDKKPDDVENAVLQQFHVIDESISWEEIDSSELHNQYSYR